MFSKSTMDCIKVDLKFPKKISPNAIVGTIMDSPCVSLDKIFCTLHFDHDYDHHDHIVIRNSHFLFKIMVTFVKQMALQWSV